MSELKLSKLDVLKLIDLYRKHECLWNTSSALYKRQDLKRKSWKKISDEFFTSVDVVKKKIKFLRTSFKAEQKKVESFKKSGSSGDIYVPSLFYYNDLHFIVETMAIRGSSENMGKENGEDETCLEVDETPNRYSEIEDFEDRFEVSFSENFNEEYIPLTDTLEIVPLEVEKENVHPTTTRNFSPMSGNQKTIPSISKRKRPFQNISSKYDNAIETILNSARETPKQEDMFITFGRSIAMQIKQLPLLEANKTMGAVQALVSEQIADFLLNKSLTDLTKEC